MLVTKNKPSLVLRTSELVDSQISIMIRQKKTRASGLGWTSAGLPHENSALPSPDIRLTGFT